VAEDVFEHDDAIVDDHSHGKGQPREGDDVDRASGGGHHQKGGHDRDRDRERDDKGAAPRSQEEQQNQNGQGAADVDIGSYEVDRGVDVVGLLIDQLQPESLGIEQVAVDLGHDHAHLFHHVEHVAPGRTLGVERQSRAANRANEDSRLAVAQLGVSHVANVDRCAARRRKDDVLNVFGCVIVPRGAYDVAPLALVEVPRRVILVFRGQGQGHIGHRQVTHGKPIRVDDDLHLALAAAEHVDTRDTGNPFDTRLDLVFDVVEKGFHVDIVVAFGEDHEPRGGLRVGIDGVDQRLVDIVRVGRDLLQTIRDTHEDRVRVGSDGELHHDLAPAVVGLAFQLAQTVETLELLLLLVDDLALDLERARTGPRRQNGRPGAVDVRSQLDGNEP